jgi:hypothetical protein
MDAIDTLYATKRLRRSVRRCWPAWRAGGANDVRQHV